MVLTNKQKFYIMVVFLFILACFISYLYFNNGYNPSSVQKASAVISPAAPIEEYILQNNNLILPPWIMVVRKNPLQPHVGDGAAAAAESKEIDADTVHAVVDADEIFDEIGVYNSMKSHLPSRNTSITSVFDEDIYDVQVVPKPIQYVTGKGFQNIMIFVSFF